MMTTHELAALAATLTVDDLDRLAVAMVLARLDSHRDSPEAAELPRLIDASMALRADPVGADHG